MKNNTYDPQQIAMLIAAVLLALSRWRSNVILTDVAMAILLLGMIAPKCFLPIARAWSWVAAKMSGIASHVLLAVVYVLVVIPVSLIRRSLGKENTLNPRGPSSWMDTTHAFGPGDLDHPF